MGDAEEMGTDSQLQKLAGDDDDGDHDDDDDDDGDGDPPEHAFSITGVMFHCVCHSIDRQPELSSLLLFQFFKMPNICSSFVFCTIYTIT